MKTVAYIRNITLYVNDDVKINKYFSLRNGSYDDRVLIDFYPSIDHDNEFIESYPRYFRRAIELALSQVLISPRCLLDEGNNKLFWNSCIFISHYGKSEYINDDIYRINSEDIEKIKLWHNLLIEHHNNYSINNGPRYFYWDIAYNEYINGLYCSYLEEAFIHLMTALEALTVKGDKNIGYYVSLNTSILCSKSQEERQEINSLVKEIYKLRSKIVHGDDKAIKKLFRDDKLYNKMFKIRKLVSEVLFLTYGKDKVTVIREIRNMEN